MKLPIAFRLAISAFAILGSILIAGAPALAVIDYGSGTGTRVFTSPVPILSNYEGDWGSFLGTAIGSYYFISAKHINGVFGAGIGQTFTLNSQNYTVTAQFDSPSSDLTVWEVNPNTTAIPSGNIVPLYPLYSTFSSGFEGGKSLVVTGRGTDVGTPVTVSGNLKGWQWGNSDGLQSWGTNTVNGVVNGGTGYGQLLRYTFDSTGGFDEGMLSVGDSGGGLFIQDPNDGTWKLAGINFSVDSPYSLSPTGSSPFNAAIFDRSGLYQNEGTWVAESGAASSYDTRIAANDTWINSITGSPTWKGAAGNANWSSGTNWSTSPTNGSNLIFSGTSQLNATNDTLTSVGSITFDGAAGSFTLSNNALTISGGITNFSTNNENVNLNLTLSAAQQFNAISGNLTVNGSIANGGNALTVTGSSNTTLAGTVSGGGAIIKTGIGTLTLSNSNSYGGGTTVSAGNLVVANYHALGSAGLVVNSGAKATLQSGLPTAVLLPSLSIDSGSSAPSSLLDIKNNKLILSNANATAANTTHATVTNQVLHAYDNFAWDQGGITSSTVQNDVNNNVLTSIGIMLNNDGGGGNLYSELNGTSTFGGQATDANSVLVRYTYLGDLNLDGVVDANDYNLFALGYAGGAPQADWAWGDLDYNGIIDSGDFNLFALGYAANAGLPTITSAGGVQPVPEPGTFVLAMLALAGLSATGIRRRLRNSA